MFAIDLQWDLHKSPFIPQKCPGGSSAPRRRPPVTLVSTDAAYWKLCKDYIKPGDRPLTLQSRTEYGCPFDCGLRAGPGNLHRAISGVSA